MNPVVVLLLAQIIFSSKDLIARHTVKGQQFNLDLLSKPTIWLIILMHTVGLVLQLYILTSFSLGRTQTAFAVLSIVFANTLGWLFLGEQITMAIYFALVLAFASFLILAFAVK